MPLACTMLISTGWTRLLVRLMIPAPFREVTLAAWIPLIKFTVEAVLTVRPPPGMAPMLPIPRTAEVFTVSVERSVGPSPRRSSSPAATVVLDTPA